MDKIKIGEFIATCRKEQNLTQEQLAEKLNVSKNAVSKWERGICLMDMKLLKPLSKILNVSVNEIIAGERIDNEDLAKKSEENIISLAEHNRLKSQLYGNTGMLIMSILLTIISLIKNMSYVVNSGFSSIIDTGFAVIFLSRYRLNKNKLFLVVGILCAISAIYFTYLFIIG